RQRIDFPHRRQVADSPLVFCRPRDTRRLRPADRSGGDRSGDLGPPHPRRGGENGRARPHPARTTGASSPTPGPSAHALAPVVNLASPAALGKFPTKEPPSGYAIYRSETFRGGAEKEEETWESFGPSSWA